MRAQQMLAQHSMTYTEIGCCTWMPPARRPRRLGGSGRCLSGALMEGWWAALNDARDFLMALMPATCVACRCVIVRDGSIIARGHNLTNETRNVRPTPSASSIARGMHGQALTSQVTQVSGATMEPLRNRSLNASNLALMHETLVAATRKHWCDTCVCA